MNNNNNNDAYEGLEKRELEALFTLLDMPYLTTHSLADFRFPNFWGKKRRRSAPPPVNDAVPAPLLVPSPENSVTPNTILSCPHSDSDEKSKRQSTMRKTSVKKTKEELLRVIEDNTQNHRTLTLEIDRVKLHYQTLKDENTELKAKKLKLEEMRRGSDSVRPGPSTSTVHPHHPPLIILQLNPAVQEQPQQVPFEFDLNVAATEEDEIPVQVQPLDEIPVQVQPLDEIPVQLQPLDESPVQSQPLDYDLMSRMAHAERTRAARHHRISLNRTKKTQRGR